MIVDHQLNGTCTFCYTDGTSALTSTTASRITTLAQFPSVIDKKNNKKITHGNTSIDIEK